MIAAATSELSKATQDLDRSLLDNHVLPTFGAKAVSSIRKSEISAWLSRLDVSSSTKSKCLQKLSAILDLAKGDGAIKSNPADGVDRPTVRSREGRALSDTEIASVIDAAEKVDPDMATMVWLMARAGLRVGEVLALKRSDVDLAGRMLRINASMSRREGLRPAKGDSSRTIPMAQDLAERLREHLARTVASIDGWLFTAPRGGRLRYDNWRTRTWNKIGGLADIGDVHPHDLRHSTATRLFLVDGWTVPQVQAFLDHADPKVTLSIYTHVAAEDLPDPSCGHFVDTLGG